MFEKVRAEFVLPETEVAEQAYRFAEQIEPAFVFAHSVRSYLACDEDWCRILSVMANGDLMLAAISGRRAIAAGVELPAAGVQPVQR